MITTVIVYKKLEGHTSFVSFVSFNNDNSMIISSDYSGIRTWNLENGKNILKIDSQTGNCKLNNDCTKIVCVSEDDGLIKLWSIITGKLLKQFKLPYSFSSVDINHNSTKIIVSSFLGDGNEYDYKFTNINIYLWDIKKYDEKNSKLLKVSKDPHQSLIDLYAFNSEKVYKDSHKDIIDNIRFNNDSTMFISGSEDSTIKIWHCSKLYLIKW